MVLLYSNKENVMKHKFQKWLVRYDRPFGLFILTIAGVTVVGVLGIVL